VGAVPVVRQQADLLGQQLINPGQELRWIRPVVCPDKQLRQHHARRVQPARYWKNRCAKPAGRRRCADRILVSRRKFIQASPAWFPVSDPCKSPPGYGHPPPSTNRPTCRPSCLLGRASTPVAVPATSWAWFATAP